MKDYIWWMETYGMQLVTFKTWGDDFCLSRALSSYMATMLSDDQE